MSLLQAIADAKALVATLEALLPEPASDIPWYENIPKEGVLCYVNDYKYWCMQEPFKHSCFTRKVFKYSAGTGFEALSTHCGLAIEWKYAIPVDPALRLPNGRIF